MKNIFFAIIAILVLSSCRKVIEIDLNTSNPQYVIEGEMTSENRPSQVKITKTANFSDSNNFPAVTGAIVTISDDANNSETLTETKSGVYETKKLVGTPGRTYMLTVKHDGKTFTSVSKMPTLIPLIDIGNIPDNFGGGGPGGTDTAQVFRAVPLFQDIVNVKNYYRFIQKVNKKVDKSFLVRDDELSDGKISVQPLFTFGSTIYRGDTLKIALQSIDKQVYDYFFSLNASSGNGPGGGATPANPVNNIIGGALGYFSAHSVSEKTIIVK